MIIGGIDCGCLLSLSTPTAVTLIAIPLFLLYLIRPRHAKYTNTSNKDGSNKNAPPMVLSSPVVKIPFIGQILEFGKSPVKMTKRCYDQYGPVFTIPVSSSK
jgi:hypothetical protein